MLSTLHLEASSKWDMKKNRVAEQNYKLKGASMLELE